MVNKQDEQETMIQLENCDSISIKESWWNESHNWNKMIESYELFQKDKQGKRGVNLLSVLRK